MHLQQQDWQQLHEGGPVFLDVDLVWFLAASVKNMILQFNSNQETI
jgi:hypothetical protein